MNQDDRPRCLPLLDAIAADHVITTAGTSMGQGWVGIAEGRITEVREGSPPRELRVLHGGHGSILLPGLISAHTHLALGSFAGIADDAPFFDWLQGGMLPELEKAATAPERFLEGARVSALELIEGGVTCVGDIFFRTDGVAALRESGQSGLFFQEVFGGVAADEDEYLAKTMAELDELPNFLGGFPFGYSPHTPWTCPARTLAAIAERARLEQRRLSCHLDESPEEHAFFRTAAGPLYEQVARRGTLDRYRFGETPTAYLDGLGVLGPDFIAVHCVQVTPEDIERLARSGSHVVHCPFSNLKLAEGFAPIAEMLEAGVNVALGVDSAASTGRLDIFEEMRLCLLAQRGRHKRIGSMTAATVFGMATMGGARALGFEDRVGSIEPGKNAELVLMRLSSPRRVVERDSVAAVVYGGTSAAVTAVVTAGVLRFRRRR